MIQREPSHYSLNDTEKVRDMALETIALFRTLGTLSAWPYWKFPTARWEDKIDMTQLFRELLAMMGREKEATITANTMLHGLHMSRSTRFLRLYTTTNQSDHIHGNGM